MLHQPVVVAFAYITGGRSSGVRVRCAPDTGDALPVRHAPLTPQIGADLPLPVRAGSALLVLSVRDLTTRGNHAPAIHKRRSVHELSFGKMSDALVHKIHDS